MAGLIPAIHALFGIRVRRKAFMPGTRPGMTVLRPRRIFAVGSEERMQLDPKEVEEVAKTLYIRAVKLLPPDIKRGFERLMAAETDATGRAVLNTMVENIAVAEKRQN